MQHHKSEDFLKVYKENFSGREAERVLEIGVQFGGSLPIWKEYFPKAEIIGFDNDPRCEYYVKDFKLVIGDQKDTTLLDTLGEFDIIIDDGGHKMSQQQETFKFLINKLKTGGVYVIEDLHTSYWDEFLDDRPTTEFIKDLIDDLHQYATDSVRHKTGRKFTNRFGVTALKIYPGIIFIFK